LEELEATESRLQLQVLQLLAAAVAVVVLPIVQMVRPARAAAVPVEKLVTFLAIMERRILVVAVVALDTKTA
jgi:hypothetical protein